MEQRNVYMESVNDFRKYEKVYAGNIPGHGDNQGSYWEAENIYVIPGTFGWDAVGSWLAVERIRRSNECGNVVEGNIITVDCKNNIIQGDKKLIAAVGIEGMVIVDTEDATLICDKGSTGDIKKVLENLKLNNRDGYI